MEHNLNLKLFPTRLCLIRKKLLDAVSKVSLAGFIGLALLGVCANSRRHHWKKIFSFHKNESVDDQSIAADLKSVYKNSKTPIFVEFLKHRHAPICPNCVFFLSPVEFGYVDLTSLKSVQQFVQSFRSRGLPLHVLVNNGPLALEFHLFVPPQSPPP